MLLTSSPLLINTKLSTYQNDAVARAINIIFLCGNSKEKFGNY